MDTPIVEFVAKYNKSNTSRLHMPGHKGINILGVEHLDITEIKGADELFHCEGIIKSSQDNASEIFGSYKTLYSTEGSTQCIKAMLLLALKECKSEKPVIIAARNAHKAFIHACALLDIDVQWMYPEKTKSFCSCNITAADVNNAIEKCEDKPIGVFITSPDYLGNILDIGSIAEVAHKNDIPLLVDNAHGAYLKFLGKHPLALGADMCCDSAHKTLPVITGGAYLHISNIACKTFKTQSQKALEVFSSSSPSYLILQSLDMCNKILYDSYGRDLEITIIKLNQLKKDLTNLGCNVLPSEELKLVLSCNGKGDIMSKILRDFDVEFEYSDNDCVVMMFSPYNSDIDFNRVKLAFTNNKFPISEEGLREEFFITGKSVMSLKKAFMSPSEDVLISEAVGRICATPTISCPPAIPIVLSGEIIGIEHIKLFEKFNISTVNVVKQIETSNFK